MKKQFLYLLTLGLVLMIGCQKELSFEAGKNLSEGSLQSDITGDCLPKTVNGDYVAGTALVTTSNTISVQVEVTKAGSYKIHTDTVNGYFFTGTGTFPTTGSTTVTLKGIGTPLNEGINNFVVKYDSSVCAIAVTVLPLGSGGAAAFTLAGTPSCTTPVINGTYAIGVSLSASNTVVLNVNVTAIGAYNISTTATNGMTFSATGTFAATGAQTVTLTGTGTPTAGGNTTIPITAGSSTCSFVIPVTSASVFTLAGSPTACTPFAINGIYVLSTALATSNTVQVAVNVTTTGAYTLTTNTVNGFSFSASGTFSATGTQTVTLNGTGTPANTGATTFTVTAGTSSCTFVITVVPIDYFPRTTNSNWSYEYDDNSADSLFRKVIPQTQSAIGNTYNIFMENNGSGLDSSGYFRKSGTDYFQYLDLGNFIGFDNPQWDEYVFLKDAAAGTTWNSSVGGYAGTITVAPNPPSSLTIRFKYTVLQKDVPVSITTSTGTINYTNVIVVEEKYEQFTGGIWVDVTSVVGYGKSYYARNIGLIKFEAFDQTGTLSYKMELRRFQVF